MSDCVGGAGVKCGACRLWNPFPFYRRGSVVRVWVPVVGGCASMSGVPNNAL